MPTLSLVCKKWKDVSLDPHHYQNLYKTYFPERSVPHLEENENWHRGFFREIDHHIQVFKRIPACEELMKTFSTTNIPTEAFITLKELRDIHNLEILYSAIKRDRLSHWKREGDYKNLTNCNKLKYIREEIIKASSEPITKLVFIGTRDVYRLTSLPSEIGYFTQLELLQIFDTTISSLPAEIGKLINLRRLLLSKNKLTNLPSNIGNLPHLRELSLRQNQLENLPAEIGKLTNLRHLILSQNKLTNLPPEIGHLSLLQELSIRHNQLESLPAEIGKLRELEELDLEHNKIRYLHQSIRNLPKIRDKYRIAFENYATEE